MDSSIRVLIFQHNPMSYKSANGRTLAMFFSSFQKENLAQIYVSNMEPNFEVCNNYYKISEKAMLKNIADTGTPEENTISKKESLSLSSKGSKQVPSFFKGYVTILRDKIWHRKRWNTEKLNQWIKSFQPDCLFFSAGNIASEYEMALIICDNYKIPLVMHIGDDYFTKTSYFPLSTMLYQKRMHNCFVSAYEKSGSIVAIGEAMKKAIISKFGEKPCVVSMNAVDIHKVYAPYVHKEPFQIAYMGNLGLDRIDTILFLCRALQKLNKERERFHLNIYTRSKFSSAVLKKIASYSCCTLHDPIEKEQVEKVTEESNILLHVESFKKKWRTILETAVSTKTPELLISGRPIIVIGPQYSSTVDFFSLTGTAIVINSREQDIIAASIEDGLSDEEICRRHTVKAREIAVEYFSSMKTSRHVRDAIEEAIHSTMSKVDIL